MTTDEALTAVLAQLASVSRAPMTAAERELRSRPLLAGGVTASELAKATARADLPWTIAQAKEYGIDVRTWLHAVHIVDLPASTNASDLLNRLHRVEAAAELLKAGYTGGRNPLGQITWSGR